MTQDTARLLDYLVHIVQAIGRIKHYTAGMKDRDFRNSELVQDAVVRNIEIIGEAAKNIERHHPEFAAQHPEVPWAVIYAMRNRVSHGYFDVDLDVVWNTIGNDLPDLERQVLQLRLRLGAP